MTALRTFFLLASSGITFAATRTDLITKIPISFEPANSGGYMARGPGYLLHLTRQENVLTLPDPVSRTKSSIRISFPGAHREAGGMEPLEPRGAHSNYFQGSDPRKWRTDVPQFGKVRIPDLYPGIDLVYYGSARTLEYDFVVHPKADSKLIEFEVHGAKEIEIDSSGDLILSLDGDEVRWKAPHVYQEAAQMRIPVEGAFELAGRRRVRFRIGEYDRSRPLVIDPVLSYSSYLGGSLPDLAAAIATDASGNVYVAGGSDSSNLMVTTGILQAIISSPADAFVAKFSPSGALIYLTYMGGSKNDYIVSMAVDSAGNAYVAGMTNSTNFPVTSGVIQKSFAGIGGNFCRSGWFGDAFVAKLNPAGSQLIYSTYLGGKQDDVASSIAIDPSGNAYVTGFTLSPDFPTTPGAYQTTFAGSGGQIGKPACSGSPWFNSGDAFIAKINPSGSQLVFSTFLGGRNDEFGTTIGIDSSQNVYIGGFTLSTNFPVTSGAFQTTWKGVDVQARFWSMGDGFLSKLDSSGSKLVYSTYLGGAGDEAVISLRVLGDGSVWATGSTSSQDFPVSSNAVQNRYAGYYTLPFQVEQLLGDAFAVHLDASGAKLLYSTYLGGSQNDLGSSIAVDPAGLVYIAGFTDSYDFPLSANAIQKKLAGDTGQARFFQFGDGFVTVLDPNASKIVYSSYYGGSLDDELFAIALDGSGGVWAAGNTVSKDLPTSAGSVQRSYGGGVMTPDFFTGDALLVHFTNLAPAATVPAILTDGTGVINGGSYAPGNVVSGSWVAIKGSGFTDQTVDWSSFDFSKGALPTQLNGLQVLFNGQPGSIWYLIAGTPQQINVQAPANLNGNVSVQVVRNNVPSNTVTTTAVQSAPAIFSYTLDGGATFVPSAVFLDATRLGDPAVFPGARKARPGDKVILFANSLAPSAAGVVSVSGSTDPVTITIGSTTFSADFAGLVAPGEFQINITVPSLPGPGNYPITIQIDGKTSQSGVIFPYSG